MTTARRPGQMQQISKSWFQTPVLDMNFDSEMSSLYGTSEGWTLPPQWTEGSATPTQYTYFTISEASTVGHHSSSAQRKDSARSHSSDSPLVDVTNPLKRGYPSHVTGGSTVSPPATLVADSHIQGQTATTISPSQIYYESARTLPSPDDSFYLGQRAPTAESSNLEPPEYNRDSISPQTRRGSPHRTIEDAGPTTKRNTNGRKRNPEVVEPGSARSIYLDKNRKAASKCRSKQKKQQEDLVELARGVERKNKILKVEVALLRESKQELMDIVSQHVDCSNSRLEVYLQREADRIAFGSDSWPSASTNKSSSKSQSADSNASPQNY